MNDWCCCMGGGVGEGLLERLDSLWVGNVCEYCLYKIIIFVDVFVFSCILVIFGVSCCYEIFYNLGI